MPRLENLVGKRGENIAIASLLAPSPQNTPLFDPHFLGEKAEAVDLYVELVSPASGAFFLAQVKTTTGFTIVNGERRLPIKISGPKYRRLTAYRAPVYLLGVNATRLHPEVYLLGVDRDRERGFSYFPTAFPLDFVTLQALYEEVREFWQQQAVVLPRSHFLL